MQNRKEHADNMDKNEHADIIKYRGNCGEHRYWFYTADNIEFEGKCGQNRIRRKLRITQNKEEIADDIELEGVCGQYRLRRKLRTKRNKKEIADGIGISYILWIIYNVEETAENIE